jgi:hypothetical protein
MNEEAVDGPFAFTVTLVSTDTSVGAQGIYVLVGMYVTNIGRTSQTYSAAYQRLLDSAGREYSPDIRATMRLTNGAGPLDINPGNRPLVGLLFDVPKGTQPSQYLLLLHASPDSPGVTVSLK